MKYNPKAEFRLRYLSLLILEKVLNEEQTPEIEKVEKKLHGWLGRMRSCKGKDWRRQRIFWTESDQTKAAYHLVPWMELLHSKGGGLGILKSLGHKQNAPGQMVEAIVQSD